ncbi:MAG: hypothetical protein IAE91_07845 [Ignavibacteriaceae bacterium]|nr:hypothetical protein [Ignavibacteriaceae bacterium]
MEITEEKRNLWAGQFPQLFEILKDDEEILKVFIENEFKSIELQKQLKEENEKKGEEVARAVAKGLKKAGSSKIYGLRSIDTSKRGSELQNRLIDSIISENYRG